MVTTIAFSLRFHLTACPLLLFFFVSDPNSFVFLSRLSSPFYVTILFQISCAPRKKERKKTILFFFQKNRSCTYRSSLKEKSLYRHNMLFHTHPPSLPLPLPCIQCVQKLQNASFVCLFSRNAFSPILFTFLFFSEVYESSCWMPFWFVRRLQLLLAPFYISHNTTYTAHLLSSQSILTKQALTKKSRCYLIVRLCSHVLLTDIN